MVTLNLSMHVILHCCMRLKPLSYTCTINASYQSSLISENNRLERSVLIQQFSNDVKVKIE